MRNSFGLRSGSLESVPLKSVELCCDITDVVYNMSARFDYQNDSGELVNCSYTFPINNVAVYHFEAQIGDRRVVAQCRPKKEVSYC